MRKCFPSHYYVLYNLEILIENIMDYLSYECLENDYLISLISETETYFKKVTDKENTEIPQEM